MKKIATVVMLLTTLFIVKNSIAQATKNQSAAKANLDWQGTYYGITPCASCEGIETVLQLQSKNTYVLTTKYVGKQDTATIKKGSFYWKGNNIVLKNTTTPTMFKVEENRVRVLNTKGEVVIGNLEKNYMLFKTGNVAVENKRWKLIELMGKPITESATTHYIIFHAKQGRIEAKAGCNQMGFGYTLRNQTQLQVQQGISTLMACPNENIEQLFTEAITNADNISIGNNGKTLSLNKARMAPLVRFELVAEK